MGSMGAKGLTQPARTLLGKSCRLANFINNKNAATRSTIFPLFSSSEFLQSYLVKHFYSLLPFRFALRIYLAITSSPDLIECKVETATKTILLLQTRTGGTLTLWEMLYRWYRFCI